MHLPPWPFFDSEQIDIASSVLSSGNVNYWTGPHGRLFEEEFARWVGTSHAVAVSNGSLALSAAYLSIGLGENDEIITTPRTFLATSSSAVLLKAKPIFADVDYESGCISVETIEPLITKKTKAISVVHLGGWPADMDAICKLAKAYGLFVIEDCAQAHGAEILSNGIWKSVGSFGDVSAWSFCQDKIISTAGEGGMVTTSNPDIWERVWSLKDHGKTQESVFERHHPPGFRWLHDKFGSNFRLTEIQSAIGRNQLNKLKSWTNIRDRNASLLIEGLSKCPVVRVPTPPLNFRHAWYKFHCYINPKYISSEWSRDRIIDELVKMGYPGLSGSCSEIYLEKCFQENGLKPTQRLPNAKLLGETSLMFLVHPTITYEQMVEYVDKACNILSRALR